MPLFRPAGEEDMTAEEVKFFIPSIEKNLNPTDLTIDCLVLGWSSSFNEFNKFLEGNIGHVGHRKIVCEPHVTHRLCVGDFCPQCLLPIIINVFTWISTTPSTIC